MSDSDSSVDLDTNDVAGYTGMLRHNAAADRKAILDSQTRLVTGNVVSKSLPGRGNGLVAKHKIKSRKLVLFVPEPLLLAVETAKLQTSCYACLRLTVEGGGPPEPTLDLKTCTGCRTVRFCDKNCQKRAWTRYHKFECPIYGKQQPRVLPAMVRAMIRLLKQREAGLIADEDWQALEKLDSHYDLMQEAGGERWQDAFLMSKATRSYSGLQAMPLEQILRLYCTLTINSFTLTNLFFEPVGIALHPLPATINHSCDPNTIIRFDVHDMSSSLASAQPNTILRTTLTVQSLRNIKAGEEITISYIDSTFPHDQRQQELKERYFFTCTCSLCQRGLLSPTYPPGSDPAHINEVTTQATRALKTLPCPSPLPPILKPALTSTLKILATISHPLHIYPYPQIRLQLILLLLDASTFYDAMLHSAILVFCCDEEMYTFPHHPSRVINMYRLLLCAQHVFATKPLDSTWTANDKQSLEKLICVTSLELTRSLVNGQCFIRGWEEGAMMDMNQNLYVKGDLEVAVLSTTEEVRTTMKMWGQMWGQALSSVEEAKKAYGQVNQWLGEKIEAVLKWEGRVPEYGDMRGIMGLDEQE